jgi:hypothetical protein
MSLRPESQLSAYPASRAQCLRNVEDGPKTSPARPQTSCGILRSRSSRSGPRDRSYASRWGDLPSSRIPDQWRPVGSRQRWVTNRPPEEAVQHRPAISVSHRGLTQRKENLTPSPKRSKGRGGHPTPRSAGLTAAPKALPAPIPSRLANSSHGSASRLYLLARTRPFSAGKGRHSACLRCRYERPGVRFASEGPGGHRKPATGIDHTFADYAVEPGFGSATGYLPQP